MRGIAEPGSWPGHDLTVGATGQKTDRRTSGRLPLTVETGEPRFRPGLNPPHALAHARSLPLFPRTRGAGSQLGRAWPPPAAGRARAHRRGGAERQVTQDFGRPESQEFGECRPQEGSTSSPRPPGTAAHLAAWAVRPRRPRTAPRPSRAPRGRAAAAVPSSVPRPSVRGRPRPSVPRPRPRPSAAVHDETAASPRPSGARAAE